MLRPENIFRDIVVFGAITNVRQGIDLTDYNGLVRELRRDPSPPRCAGVIVVPATEDAHQYVETLRVSAGFALSPRDRYTNYAAYQHDVAELLRDVLTIYAHPHELASRVLSSAGLEIMAGVTPRR